MQEITRFKCYLTPRNVELNQIHADPHQQHQDQRCAARMIQILQKGTIIRALDIPFLTIVQMDVVRVANVRDRTCSMILNVVYAAVCDVVVYVLAHVVHV